MTNWMSPNPFTPITDPPLRKGSKYAITPTARGTLYAPSKQAAVMAAQTAIAHGYGASVYDATTGEQVWPGGRRSRRRRNPKEFGTSTGWVPLGPHGQQVRNLPLVTSQDTRKSERLVRSVARAQFGRKFYDAFYEHGQWWVSVGPTGERTYAAVDSVPGFDGRGVAFEAIG
jgi:hypothetical protein